MNRIYFLISSLGLVGCLYAQMPQRLPEEEAAKHTEMMCRELNIRDTTQRRKIFAMYLEHAYQRQRSNTRMEQLQRMEDANEKLKTILDPEQYNRFMNTQINPAPRHPQHPYEAIPGPSSAPDMPPEPPMPPL